MVRDTLTVAVRDVARRLGEVIALVLTWFFARVQRIRLQEGQSMVEYAIIAALIAIVAMSAVQALGTGIAGVFQRILASVSGIG